MQNTSDWYKLQWNCFFFFHYYFRLFVFALRILFCYFLLHLFHDKYEHKLLDVPLLNHFTMQCAQYTVVHHWISITINENHYFFFFTFLELIPIEYKMSRVEIELVCVRVYLSSSLSLSHNFFFYFKKFTYFMLYVDRLFKIIKSMSEHMEMFQWNDISVFVLNNNNIFFFWI